jgi:leucine efflux protein
VLSVATARGVKAGFQGALGVFLGDTVLLVLVALGAAGLLRTTPALFMVVKYAGAAYLGWVGVQLLLAALQKWRGADDSAGSTVPVVPAHLAKPFQRALLVSLLNPKAILFLLSFFVQFIDPNYATPAVPFLILSAIVMGFSAVYLSVLIVMGARLADGFRERGKLSAILSSAVGAVFVWFGVKLASASLS